MADEASGGAGRGRGAHHRALVRSFIGKKVIVSTTDFHYVVGQLVDVVSGDELHLSVAGRSVYVRCAAVARILEADPAVAEYVK